VDRKAAPLRLVSLPSELRSQVKSAVAELGRVIALELGEDEYRRIEELRARMAELRDSDRPDTERVLRTTLRELSRLSPSRRLEIARAYTLMLEVMNACENAYRTWRLRQHAPEPAFSHPDGVIYVVTAHPTEARSPENIAIFHELQRALVDAYQRGFEHERERIRHLLEVAWRAPIVRARKPSVRDEADYIHSILLRRETLDTLLRIHQEWVPLYIRSWVGGDKDGHPGVDARTFRESLQISRRHLISYLREELEATAETLDLFPSQPIRERLRTALRKLYSIAILRTGDAERVRRFRREIRALVSTYRDQVHAEHPSLAKIERLMDVFPGFVVPLELRESSDVLMAKGSDGPHALRGMLHELARISRGGNPRWYARGLIISMASELSHVQKAAELSVEALGSCRLPIVPLFEQREALEDAPRVVGEILGDRSLRKAVRESWGDSLEVMLGYSDSAKEIGVFPSRLEIGRAMRRIETVCLRSGVRPIFFHGSGGSVDRGGGSVQDQVAWLPRSSLKLYKATIQGEMIERSFASPEIALRQIERIVRASAGTTGPKQARGEVARALGALAERISKCYRDQVHDPSFLELVERGTPYPYLSYLKIGSRPTKRKKAFVVEALRAIPWVLCWTQTRVLFPTWWGVGHAWSELDARGRRALGQAYREQAVFRSFIHALGFTLAKVELPVWRMYLESAGVPKPRIDAILARFERELGLAIQLVRSITGSKDLLSFRPWLGVSIQLRAPMIHPLNLLQVIALREKDFTLLRVTVTGVASGMLTTG
jgi:phosphoenolpyruvate carboxylase